MSQRMKKHRTTATSNKQGGVHQYLNQAISFHQQGMLSQARDLYSRVLGLNPDQPDALHLLSQIVRQQGDLPGALQLVQKAIANSPTNAPFFNTLGNTLRLCGQRDKAIDAYQNAISLQPNFAEAHNNLGVVFLEGADVPSAISHFKLALGLKPSYADASNNLCNALKALGYLSEAIAAYKQALEWVPQSAEVWNNLGVVYQETWCWNEAIACYERALALRPESAEVHANIGSVLADIGRHQEAISHLKHAIAIRPEYPVALCNLGNILIEIGSVAEGEACFEQAAGIAADSALVNRLISIKNFKQRRLVDARDFALRALKTAQHRDRAMTLSNLASILGLMSDFEQVKRISDEALVTTQWEEELWENRLYTFSYHPDLSAEEIFAEFVRWGDGQKLKVPDHYANDKNPNRRIRVGFVSPDFRRHTSRFYFAPLFEHYDREQIEFIAYSNVLRDDDWTEKFRGWVDDWRDIRGMSDEAVAEQIQADRIDILIDGCNHMQDHRLGVFRFKPAPIQVTWLGAAWTTGLSTVDYVLFDPYLAPEGTLAREKIVRLPGCFIAYRPPESVGEVVAPPALKNGYVTFGYTGRTERLNHRTFRAWGEILQRLPNARLILDYGPFSDPPTQAYYRDLLVAHGVDVTRVQMRNSGNIFEGLGDIDILLDCFPHSGGTMLFDALWMGVPALTLTSRPPVGRIGTSLMMNLGLQEWVARNENEYIVQAINLAQDVGKLVDIRMGMRERMSNSPLMDELGFATAYISALRNMWKKWCEVKN